MWVTTPETDRIEELLRTMAAVMWGVRVEDVTLQRVDRDGVGVTLRHRSIVSLRWGWYGDPEKCNVGTLGILNLALDAYRDDLTRRAIAIQSALDAYYGA